jgi:hypothetical protein
MKKQVTTILIILTLIIVWCKYLPEKSIYGKYINNNTQPILEGPNSIEHGIDTLIIYENGKFESNAWGKGTYKIENRKRISFTYDYEFGKAGYNTNISKSTLGKIRIILNQDLNFYYEKIDSTS